MNWADRKSLESLSGVKREAFTDANGLNADGELPSMSVQQWNNNEPHDFKVLNC